MQAFAYIVNCVVFELFPEHLGLSGPDAVQIALTNGLTRKQVLSELGAGLPTLNKWVTTHPDTEVVAGKTSRSHTRA
ncbi:hypothetical protein [Actibacterium mucosum]|nr:hypothetical protein [Actibacterium mucosum]